MPLRLFHRVVVAGALVGAITVVPVADTSLPAQVERADEYRVKAAILYNLAKFVDWPPEAISGPQAPLVVCVLGVDPFGPALDDALKGRLVGGHPLAVRRMGGLSPGCHVLFVSASERKRTAIVIEDLGASPVLTVGDDDGFDTAGGMIELVTVRETVRFNINREAVDRARLHLSARLLALASNIHPAAGVVR
jgi:hypothetical protein